MSTEFTVYPAIDLRDGQVVRLVQGDPQRQTVYSRDPAEVARRWVQAGATWLHVVDLDAALGQPGEANRQALHSILAMTQAASPLVRVQLGGGLRQREGIEAVLELGVSRVVLGTAVIEDPELLAWALYCFGPERVAGALDARDGQIQVRGWTQPGGVSATELAVRMRDNGLRLAFYTDISRDGQGSGVNIDATQRLMRATGLEVAASGGAAGLDDVRRIRQAGLSGVIIGRALYEGQIRLEEALRC